MDNPFATPEADSDVRATVDGPPLATLTQRIVGGLIDRLLYSLAFILPFAFIGALAGVEGWEDETFAAAALSFGTLTFMLITGVQAWFITKDGQSIGKMIAGTRIVREDAGAVGFTRGVLLREWLLMISGMFCALGGIAAIIDPFFIFRENRKALRDEIADTRVVSIR